MNIDRTLIARYLGYRDAKLDGEIRSRMEESLRELENAAEKRCVWVKYPIERPAPGVVSLGGVELTSQGLSDALEGCEAAVVMAVTLGSGADMLLRRWQSLDMSRAVILQACAAAMVEAYGEDCLKEPERDGLHADLLFCPGYGDFGMENQPKLLNLLDAGKRIGVMLTRGQMLVPSKSMVGVTGLRRGSACRREGHDCTRCGKTDCPYRKTEQIRK